jgi:hypothetical protein
MFLLTCKSWAGAVLVASLVAPASAGPVFYGFTLSANSTLVSIDTSTGVATAIGSGSGFGNVSGSAFNPDGLLYAIDGSKHVFSVNLATGVGTFFENTPVQFVGMEIAGDGTAWMGTSAGELWKRDSSTDAYSDVGPMQFTNFMDFAIDSQGHLFAVGSSPTGTGNSYLYQINTGTGHGTLVATVTVPCLMGIAFDPSNTLYATEFCGGSAHPLYQVDLSTGAATPIGAGTGIASLHGGDIAPVPEPQTWFAAPPALALILMARRRRGIRRRV